MLRQALMLPVDNSKVFGKEAGKDLAAAELGPPYMDHASSTEQSAPLLAN